MQHDWQKELEALEVDTAHPAQPDVKPGEPVAWRLRNTAFRTEVFEYFRTRFSAECRQMQFNASVDDGGLHELTPLYTGAPAPKPDVLDIYDKAIDKLQSQVDAFTAALPAIKEVIRISDRKHDAWDAAKAGIAAFAAPPAQTPPNKAELLCVCGAEWKWENRSWELVSTPPQTPPPRLTWDEIDVMWAKAEYQPTDAECR